MYHISFIFFLSSLLSTPIQNVLKQSTIVHITPDDIWSSLIQSDVGVSIGFRYFLYDSICCGTIYYRLYGIKYKYCIVAMLYL